MENIEIFKKFIENNNGLLITSNVKKLNIHNQYIKLFCDEKYITKLEKGVYARTDITPLKLDLTSPNNIIVNNELVYILKKIKKQS